MKSIAVLRMRDFQVGIEAVRMGGKYVERRRNISKACQWHHLAAAKQTPRSDLEASQAKSATATQSFVGMESNKAQEEQCFLLFQH